MAEFGPLGCLIPRRPRTKRPTGHSSCWLASPVLADCIVHEDEMEALVALCLIGASSPSPPASDGQPLPQLAQVRSKRRAEAQQQQQQHSKGSSSTGLVAVGPRLTGSNRRSAKRQQHTNRQHSPASDISSGGSLGGTLQSPATVREWTAEQPLVELPMTDIHPAALPVDADLLQHQLSATAHAPRHLPSAASADSAQREQLWLQAGQAVHSAGQEPCPAACHPSASDAYQLLANSGSWSAAAAPMQHCDLLALVEKALLGSPVDSAAAAAKALSAIGLGQAGVTPAVAAPLMQSNNTSTGSLNSAPVGALSCPGPLMAACEALLQAGIPVGWLGQMMAGTLAAGAVQPRALHHKQPEPHGETSGISRPPVKGCYWHVYIARKIAEDQRRAEQGKAEIELIPGTKANQFPEQGAVQIAPCAPPPAMGGPRVCAAGLSGGQPAPCAGENHAGGSPRKKQKHVQNSSHQQSEQPQQLPSMPSGNQVMDAGLVSANVPPVMIAAAAAAAAQASSVPLELPLAGPAGSGSALFPVPALHPAMLPPTAVPILPDAGPAAAAAAALLLQQQAIAGSAFQACTQSAAAVGQLTPFLSLPVAAGLAAAAPPLPSWAALHHAAPAASSAFVPGISQLHALQLMLAQPGPDSLANQARLMAHC